jgi:hypothetical protein
VGLQVILCNPETQVIMGTRHRTKTKTTIKEQSRMDNPETQVIMGTRHRTKTNITITLHRKRK